MLTPAQVQQFDQQGFIKFPGAIKADLLEQLKFEADNMQHWGFEALKRNELPKDFAFTLRFFKAYLNRVTRFHLYAGKPSLAILGSPEVLETAQDLCGGDFLLSVDMLILKNQHDELDLPWHQDLIFDANKHRVIALGVYLEDALPGDGALKLIKDSQHAIQDIDRLKQSQNLDILEVPAKAGDIVVHNPMLVHWSDMLKEQSLRRTLYYEFRSLSQVTEQAKWSDKVIRQQQRLMALAMAEFHRQNPDKPQFSISGSVKWPTIDNGTKLNDLYLEKPPQEMANFPRALTDHLVKNSSEEVLPPSCERSLTRQ